MDKETKEALSCIFYAMKYLQDGVRGQHTRSSYRNWQYDDRSISSLMGQLYARIAVSEEDSNIAPPSTISDRSA